MKWIRTLTNTAALSMVLALGSGCAAVLLTGGAAAGAGAIAYVKGELKSNESASLDQAWQASLAAVKDLEFFITSQSKDALSGHLEARTASDKKVELDLKSISAQSTEIRIRVGTFGDEAISRQILDKIKASLKK